MGTTVLFLAGMVLSLMVAGVGYIHGGRKGKLSLGRAW